MGAGLGHITDVVGREHVKKADGRELVSRRVSPRQSPPAMIAPGAGARGRRARGAWVRSRAGSMVRVGAWSNADHRRPTNGTPERRI